MGTDRALRAADKVAQLTISVKNQRLVVRHALEGPQEGRSFRLIAGSEGAVLVGLEVELQLYTLAQHHDWRNAMATACRMACAPAAPGHYGGEQGREAAKKWLRDNTSLLLEWAPTDVGMEILLRDLLQNLT